MQQGISADGAETHPTQTVTIRTPLSLTQQTERDLNAFISRRLWLRLPELRVGSRGEAVGILMGYLNGWLTLNASSLPLLQGSTFDSDMYNAVLAFQKAMGLKADGIVGRETWKKLLLP
jgi:peptidoglycan hydrolase-like protein with peptidoglycan-binding domain